MVRREQMRQFYLLVLVLVLGGASLAQRTPTASSDRMFLPSDTFWGFGQFDIAPPHNEIDPNVCRADAGTLGGKNAPCNAFARYMLWGLLEARPFGRGPFRRFMVWGEPRSLFGKYVSQTLDT